MERSGMKAAAFLVQVRLSSNSGTFNFNGSVLRVKVSHTSPAAVKSGPIQILRVAKITYNIRSRTTVRQITKDW